MLIIQKVTFSAIFKIGNSFNFDCAATFYGTQVRGNTSMTKNRKHPVYYGMYVPAAVSAHSTKTHVTLFIFAHCIINEKLSYRRPPIDFIATAYRGGAAPRRSYTGRSAFRAGVVEKASRRQHSPVLTLTTSVPPT